MTQLGFISDKTIKMNENLTHFLEIIELLKDLNSLIIPHRSLLNLPFYLDYLRYFNDRGELRDKINGKSRFFQRCSEAIRIPFDPFFEAEIKVKLEPELENESNNKKKRKWK